MIWYYCNILFLKNTWLPFSGLKKILLRIFGAKLGKNVVIKPGVNIKYPWFLEVGANSWIGENVWIDNLGMVSMGANVCISQGAMLLSGNHDFSVREFDLMVKPIVLEDGVWIGAGAIVCGGAICRSHAVLSVCSVASGTLDAFSVYKGNPAMKIRDRVIT